MTFRPDRPHPAALAYAREVRAGTLSRREFLSRATALGLSAAGAGGLIGLATPARSAAHATPGGTLRMQMTVRPMKDPRTFDWTQTAYVASGWLEHLVSYNSDGTFTPFLLSGWEVSEEATEYRLTVREGVTWNTGEPLTADDVARNITAWCDRSVPGNSMAGRLATLVDPETNKAREGAIEVLDDLTVALHLPQPDITLIAGMADYPALITHRDQDPDDFLTTALGTGPYLPDGFEERSFAALARNGDHTWWGHNALPGGGAFLDRIEFRDYGTDPAAWVAAAQADEVDALYETVGDFVDVMDGLGWTRSEILTGATIVVRTNQSAEVGGLRPYADARLRRALALAVDNAICLELGYANRGEVADNTHVGRMHPEHDPSVRAPSADPRAALALAQEAGFGDFVHELVSVDDDWRRATTDAVAAQLRDAGFAVERRLRPDTEYAEMWNQYPFSSTNWNHRPLGTQTYALAYRSGEAWNETGFSNAEFDALLAEANALADADRRRTIMGRMEEIMIEEGVIIQPYWRSLYRHARPGVTGADIHISYLPQLYRWAIDG